MLCIYWNVDEYINIIFFFKNSHNLDQVFNNTTFSAFYKSAGNHNQDFVQGMPFEKQWFEIISVDERRKLKKLRQMKNS